MTDEEIIERVAKAISIAVPASEDLLRVEWEQWDEDDREHLRTEARAAIAAYVGCLEEMDTRAYRVDKTRFPFKLRCIDWPGLQQDKADKREDVGA